MEKGIDELSFDEIMDYELKTHWLASFIWFDWGQDLMLKLTIRRVKRKYKWYQYINRSRGDIIAI